MKFKPKQILKRIVTSAVALVTATSLAVTSLALNNESSEGITGSGAYGSQIYQWINNKNIRWMFEAYVSTTDDGTIDVTRNSLGSGDSNDGQLKRIGAILYFNGISHTSSVILPAGTTTDKRNTTTLSSIYNSSTGEYYFPESTASIKPENPYYRKQTKIGDGETSYYISTKDCGLPNDINNINYSTQVRPIVESPEFTERIVRTLKESMGDNGMGMVNALYDAVSDGVKQKFSTECKSLMSTMSKEDAFAKAAEHLFPTSDDPYVQWAIVITPLSIHYANRDCAHWIISTNPLSIIKNGTYYAMDAWTLSVYNLLTTYIGSMSAPPGKNNEAATNMRNQITSKGITADFYTSTGVPNGGSSNVKPRLHGAIGASECDVFYNCFTDTFTSQSNVGGAGHYLGIKTTEYNDLRQKAWDSQNAFYLGDKWQYLAQRGGIGVALSDPPENKDSTVYHHICNIKITLPKDAKTFNYNGREIKLTSVNVKNMLMGKPFVDVDGNTIKQFDFHMINSFLDFCIENKYMSKDISSSSSCWEDPLSYVVDPTKLDKEGYYFASKDEEFLSQMEARGYPYIMVSSELTTSGKLSNVYTGPESSSEDKDRVLWRYAALNEDMFTGKVALEGQSFYKVALDLYTVCQALVETFCKGGSNTSDSNGRVIFDDQGLQAKPGDEYHTASFIVTVEEAPTDIYYHTATYDVKLKPGEPVPASVTELIDRIEDGPTWSVEKSDKPITDPQWKPSSDPVLKQVKGDITTGYVVGVSGFQDKFNPQPSEYPDTSSAVLKLEKSGLAFELIPKPIGQVEMDTTVDISNSGIAELHTAIIKFNITEARQLEKGTDRIKTYDVTQFIDQTVDAVSDSEHLKSLDQYVDNEESYNNSKMPSSHVSDKTKVAVMVSKPLSFDSNPNVRARNHLSEEDCPAYGSHWHHGSCGGHSDDDGNITYCNGCCEDTKHSESCGFVLYHCFYTMESIMVYYGLNVSQPEHYVEAPKGFLKVASGFKDGDTLKNKQEFSEVGFTIPHAYYTSPEVVKLHGSGNWSDKGQPQFLLPQVTAGSKANKFAVFDTMFNTDGEGSYRIRYFSDNGEVTHQSHEMSDNDKKQDYDSQTGYTNFDYLNNDDDISINGVQYIAHRDLLSGDNVSTSLAVSSYMARYATKSDTYEYLKFMRDSGFAFNVKGSATKDLPEQESINPKDANSKIDHANRVVWIARAATTEDLTASEDGCEKNAYNTHYIGAEPNRRNDTFIRFGLGGASADGKNMYSNFIKNSTSLSNSSLDKVDDGDALRSIWYMVNDHEQGDALQCDNTANKHEHDSWDACYSEHDSLAGHHVSGRWDLHSDNADRIHTEGISGNKYVLQDANSYLPNGYYSSHTVYDNVKQTDMFEDIYTSRITFRIPLAVEGTTNGIWDATGAEGIKYNTDILKLKDGYLTHKSVSELSDATNQKNQRTYEQTTFEVLKQNYADVGSEKQPGDRETLLAEYRFTTPTAPFHFNPSVAMAFDDKFEDNNRSVWMLSTQPREITFKNILDIRLTYNANDGDKDRKADSGYPTTVTSEWSTDKLDKDIQKATGLPTMKASNSYKTETSAVGGTITAYVVLQDPEFAPDYNAAKTYNENTMNLYKNQLEGIRNQIISAGGTITTPSKSAFGPAMYTNMTNGSSTNSMFYQDPFTSSDVLADKEPMKLLNSTKFTSKLTSGNGADISTSATDNSAWSFYALAGHKVVNNYGDPDYTDISDTTSSGNRKIFEQKIKSQTDALSHQKTQLDELNKYLKELMFEQGNSVDAPQGTTPFKDGSQEFVWYNEDYEGFVVAVYEIEFAIGGTGGEVSNADANSHAKTDFHSVYRSESDWKTDTNATIEETERSLVADYSETLQSMGIVNIVNSTGKNDFSFKDGKLDLVTVNGRKRLKDWEKELSEYNYHGEIYGIGLELANLQVAFGDIKKQPISFFYQPTYFNIRGSVYDTVR